MPGPIETTDDLDKNDTELFLAYRRELVKRGVLELPELGGSGRNCISYSHTDDDIDLTLEVPEEALAAALEEKAHGYPNAPHDVY
jgi:glutamate-1-semialdehyde 2,1-aminomutase